MFRRRTEAAGESWGKWGDPAYRAGLVHGRAERHRYIVSTYAWSIALGAWLGIAVHLVPR